MVNKVVVVFLSSNLLLEQRGKHDLSSLHSKFVNSVYFLGVTGAFFPAIKRDYLTETWFLYSGPGWLAVDEIGSSLGLS